MLTRRLGHTGGGFGFREVEKTVPVLGDARATTVAADRGGVRRRRGVIQAGRGG